MKLVTDDHGPCDAKGCSNPAVLCSLSQSGFPKDWYCKDHADLIKDEDQS